MAKIWVDFRLKQPRHRSLQVERRSRSKHVPVTSMVQTNCKRCYCLNWICFTMHGVFYYRSESKTKTLEAKIEVGSNKWNDFGGRRIRLIGFDFWDFSFWLCFIIVIWLWKLSNLLLHFENWLSRSESHRREKSDFPFFWFCFFFQLFKLARWYN